MNGLKKRLKNAEVLIGSVVSLPSSEVAETMALVGFDYLWMDMEHGPIDSLHLQAMVQAVGGRCSCLARIPENKEVWIKQALDTGCNGIIVPQVKSAEQAKEAVDCCFYPPDGRRSVGISRAHGYGSRFEDYVKEANQEVVLVLQVEDTEGVRNIESITRVPGIDAILIGPLDLSGSLGVLGQLTHPKVEEAIERVRRHCEEANVPIGIFAVDAASAKGFIAKGFTLIALGIDASYLRKSAQTALEEVRGANARD